MNQYDAEHNIGRQAGACIPFEPGIIT